MVIPLSPKRRRVESRPCIFRPSWSLVSSSGDFISVLVSVCDWQNCQLLSPKEQETSEAPQTAPEKVAWQGFVLSANQMMLDGVLQQFRIGFQTEGLHDSILVEGNSSRLEVQDVGNFLHRHPLGKKL